MASAKDKRLYARFDIGFDEHDKVFPLSDAAFRALVEATLYSRRQLTDGFLAERLAMKRWGVDVLDELSTNDPEKPSLVRVDGGWRIHDFAEHQTTNAEIEAKREAGKKGAAKRWRASINAEAMAPAMGNPMRSDGGTLAKTETETETKTDTEKPPSSSNDSEGGAASPPKTCKKHSHWDHDERCRACGVDRRAFEAWEQAEASKPKPVRPHEHRWLGDGTCNTCDARKDE